MTALAEYTITSPSETSATTAPSSTGSTASRTGPERASGSAGEGAGVRRSLTQSASTSARKVAPRCSKFLNWS